MSDPKKNPGVVFWATVVVVVVLPPYIGIYAWTVHTPSPYSVPIIHTGRFKIPVYYYGELLDSGFVFTEESGWGKIVAPIHAVDQAVRPKRWIREMGPTPPRPSVPPKPSRSR
jgi:hypothetical protein